MRSPLPRRRRLDRTRPRRAMWRRIAREFRTAALVLSIALIAGVGLAYSLWSYNSKSNVWAIAVPIFGVAAMIEINAMLRRKPYRTRASRRLRRQSVARAEERRARRSVIPDAASAVRRVRRATGEGAPSVTVRLVFAVCCVAFMGNFFGIPGALGVCVVWLAFMRFLHRRREPNALSRTQARRLADVFGTDADLPAHKPKAVRPRVVALSSSDSGER